MTMRTLGFVGLGRMGGHMARRLLGAGHDLTVFDSDAEAVARLVADGASAAASIRQVADRAEVVFVSLPTSEVVRSVALGPDGLCHGSAMTTFIDTSTTGPRVAAEIAAELAAGKVAAIDCPVSGGMAGARDGRLTLMVSGPRDAVDRAVDLLELLGNSVYVGAMPGAAQTVKLANNLLVAAAMTITAEALVMGVKAGVDPKVMCEVINASSGRNTATADKFPRAVLTGSFDFGFSTGLLYKDVRLCLDTAEALGVPTPVGAAIRQALAVTQALYGAESDFSSVVRPVETWAGCEVRSK